MSTQDEAHDLLATLVEQERTIQFDAFGHADAWAVGSELVRLGTERVLPIAISIVLGEQRVFQAGLAGSTADNDDWLERKFRAVRRFGHSSLAVGTEFRSRGLSFDENSRLPLHQYSGHGGAFPILVHGVIAGIVGVSGLAERDDHALVVEVLAAYRGTEA